MVWRYGRYRGALLGGSVTWHWLRWKACLTGGEALFQGSNLPRQVVDSRFESKHVGCIRNGRYRSRRLMAGRHDTAAVLFVGEGRLEPSFAG
jgi:hypothetical protein